MDPNEISAAKRIKSSSLDEVLEIFSTFAEPPVQSSLTNKIKQEIDDIDSPVRFGERYAHIMMKETLVDEDELLERDKKNGMTALVGNKFIKKEVTKDIDNVADIEKRSEILEQLEILRKYVHVKFLQKEVDFKELELLNDEAMKKIDHDEEKIIELEEELKAYKNSNGDIAETLNQNNQLKEDLAKKDKEAKVMEARYIHAMELVRVSAEKMKTLKRKEDNFKYLEMENARLEKLLGEQLKNQNSDSSEMLRKIDTMKAEMQAKNDKINILKETNANIENKLNSVIAASISGNIESENVKSSEVGIKVRDEEITILREKIPPNCSLQKNKLDNGNLESQLRELMHLVNKQQSQIQFLKSKLSIKQATPIVPTNTPMPSQAPRGHLRPSQVTNPGRQQQVGVGGQQMRIESQMVQQVNRMSSGQQVQQQVNMGMMTSQQLQGMSQSVMKNPQQQSLWRLSGGQGIPKQRILQGQGMTPNPRQIQQTGMMAVQQGGIMQHQMGGMQQFIPAAMQQQAMMMQQRMGGLVQVQEGMISGPE